MASWSAGLAIGLAILVANNPKTGVPQLAYRELSRLLSIPLASSAGFAVGGAVAGLMFAPAVVAILGLDYLGLEDPRAFVVVYGIHAGTYLGGVSGVVVAVVLVKKKRRS